MKNRIFAALLALAIGAPLYLLSAHAAPLTYPTSAGAEPPLFLPPAGDLVLYPVDIPSRRMTLSARTHTPCRAGPACPAAGMRFHTAGRCGHRPLRRGRRACRITNVGGGVRAVPSARQCRAGNGLPRRCAPRSKCPWGTPRNDRCVGADDRPLTNHGIWI